MRKLSFAIIVASLFAIAGCTNQGALEPVKPVDVKTYKSVGVIKNVDIDAVKATIDHEDIPGYMGAMEMNEKVRDAKLLEGLKAGDKVEFELQRTGSDLLITQLKKIGEVAIVNGGEIYKTNCAECHGGLGEGAKKGISLVSGHALNHSETEYIAQVSNGKANKMPAFKDKLSTEQIAAVVKFIRTELQKDVSPEARKEHKH